MKTKFLLIVIALYANYCALAQQNVPFQKHLFKNNMSNTVIGVQNNQKNNRALRVEGYSERLDSMVFTTSSSSGDSEEGIQKYYHNAKGQISEYLSFKDGELSYQELYTYSSSGNLLEINQLEYDNDTVYHSRTVKEYDNNSLLVSAYGKVENGVFEPYNKEEYSYNANNQLITTLGYNYQQQSLPNDTVPVWVFELDSKTEVTYTNDGKRYTSTRYNKNQTEWIVNSYDTLLYDSEDRVVKQISTNSSCSSSSGYYDSLDVYVPGVTECTLEPYVITYTYKNNNTIIELTMSSLEDGDWKIDQSVTLTYDNTVLGSSVVYPSDFLPAELLPYKLLKYEFTYEQHDDGDSVEIITTITGKVDFYYSPYVVTALDQFTSIDLNENIVYPNPAKDIITFTEVNEGSFITFYNMAGVSVKTVVLDNNSINVSELIPGMYSWIILSDEQQQVGKLVIE